MQKSKPEIEQLWPHLRYATLSDIRKELPTTLAAWAMASAVTVAVGSAAQFVAPAHTLNWESPFPAWANIAIGCSIVLWCIRGQDFRYRMPRISFGLWLGSCLYISTLCFMIASSP